MSRPPKLSPDAAMQKIGEILIEGFVEKSLHCRYDSMPKRSVDDLDVTNVLKNGEIRRAREWDAEHENWKYRVVGRDLENDELTAVTVIIEAEMTLLIVTVF